MVAGVSGWLRQGPASRSEEEGVVGERHVGEQRWRPPSEEGMGVDCVMGSEEGVQKERVLGSSGGGALPQWTA